VGTGNQDFKRGRPAKVAKSVAPPGTQAKKDPAVARRVGKFWERMPERQVLYALHTHIVQLRNDRDWLQFLQFIA
jgi:hypothetical protein